MKRGKINKSSGLSIQAGQVSRLLLVLAIIVLVAVVIVFIVLRATTAPPAPPIADEPAVPKAIYEVTLEDIKFTFQEARDMGKILLGSQSRLPDSQKDLITAEKFVIVTIGAQNKGKENIPERVWDIGDIIDSEGRRYVSLDYTANNWQPNPNLCGALLKPEFTATPCTKIYEVSKISTGLKINISALKKGSDGRYSSNEKNQETALIDLIVTQ